MKCKQLGVHEIRNVNWCEIQNINRWNMECKQLPVYEIWNVNSCEIRNINRWNMKCKQLGVYEIWNVNSCEIQNINRWNMKCKQMGVYEIWNVNSCPRLQNGDLSASSSITYLCLGFLFLLLLLFLLHLLFTFSLNPVQAISFSTRQTCSSQIQFVNLILWCQGSFNVFFFCALC